jgi:hypothetical protein
MDGRDLSKTVKMPLQRRVALLGLVQLDLSSVLACFEEIEGHGLFFLCPESRRPLLSRCYDLSLNLVRKKIALRSKIFSNIIRISFDIFPSLLP